MIDFWKLHAEAIITWGYYGFVAVMLTYALVVL